MPFPPEIINATHDARIFRALGELLRDTYLASEHQPTPHVLLCDTEYVAGTRIVSQARLNYVLRRLHASEVAAKATADDYFQKVNDNAQASRTLAQGPSAEPAPLEEVPEDVEEVDHTRAVQRHTPARVALGDGADVPKPSRPDPKRAPGGSAGRARGGKGKAR